MIRPGPRRLLLVLACLMGATLAARAQTAAATRPGDASPALPGTREGGWRELRGDPKNTGVCHGPAPSFSGVKWKFVADSDLLNSPAVADGVVYFGSRGGHVYAIRTSDGGKIWERLHAGPSDDKTQYSGFTYSSALLSGGRLFFGSEDGHLYCLSPKNGDLLWRRHLGGAAEAARIWASPKTDGRLVFIGSNSGFLWALDPERGEPRWKAWIGDQIGSSVGILGGELYVTAKDRRLHAVDAATGEVRWRVDIGGWSMSAPSIALGCAFVRASGGKAVCVDLVNHSVRFTTALPPISYAQTSFAHDGETGYVTDAASVSAIGEDGRERWQFKAKAAFDASPILVGPYVVVAGTDGMLRAIDRKSGVVAKEIDLGDKLIGTPSVVDGVAYVPGNSGILFAVE